MKLSTHKSRDCEVCGGQLSKISTFNKETGKSEGNQRTNKILQKYKFPEVVHEGLICQSCKIQPIKGNRYFCLVCSDFNLCESCGESVNHKHLLLFTSSK